jgi:hypothetical protein
VYHALDGFPSSMVGEVFTRQLERVVERCPPRLVSYELNALGRYAVRHAETDDLRRRLAASLAALLGHDPSSDEEESSSRPEIDYPIHKKVVELLADLGTSEAAAVLVVELNGLSEHGDSSATAMIVQTLEALARIPSSADLDVAQFLLAARQLPMVNQLHHVPLVLDAHRDLCHAEPATQLWSRRFDRLVLAGESGLGMELLNRGMELGN